MFRFPRDADERNEWLRKIPQANLTADGITDNMGICERHFDPSHIIRPETTPLPDCSSKVNPKLAKNAIPTIFPNTPSYLSSATPAIRNHPDSRRAEAAQRDEENFKEWLSRTA